VLKEEKYRGGFSQRYGGGGAISNKNDPSAKSAARLNRGAATSATVEQERLLHQYIIFANR